MNQGSWSLSRRLTIRFVLGTVSIVVVTSIVGGYLLQMSMNRELDALANEMIAEFERHVRVAPDDAVPEGGTDAASALVLPEQVIDEWRGRHPEFKIAWHARLSPAGPIEGFGDAELRDKFEPSVLPTDGAISLGPAIRSMTRTLPNGMSIAAIIDGKTRYEAFTKYQLFSLIAAGGSLVLALLLGWFFQSRVHGLLKRVANNIRSESSNDVLQLETEGAPVEIVMVADALQERLRRVRSESERAQLFTASLAHELRSPIQNLVGETEVALMAPRDSDYYRRVLQSNLHELRELGDAVDNLLTMCSTRSHNDSKVYAEEFDLADEAELRLSREKGRARLNDVQLAIQRMGDTRIVGDREALLRALRNLAGNAIEWSPSGKRVDITIDGRGDQVVVTIDDQGPGIPADLHQRIFEPFFTGPAKNNGRVGYGLGLAITRAAVQGHGGTIEVGRSELGGARFDVLLPRRSLLASTRAEPQGNGRAS